MLQITASTPVVIALGRSSEISFAPWPMTTSIVRVFASLRAAEQAFTPNSPAPFFPLPNCLFLFYILSRCVLVFLVLTTWLLLTLLNLFNMPSHLLFERLLAACRLLRPRVFPVTTILYCQISCNVTPRYPFSTNYCFRISVWTWLTDTLLSRSSMLNTAPVRLAALPQNRSPSKS